MSHADQYQHESHEDSVVTVYMSHLQEEIQREKFGYRLCFMCHTIHMPQFTNITNLRNRNTF